MKTKDKILNMLVCVLELKWFKATDWTVYQVDLLFKQTTWSVKSFALGRLDDKCE